MIPMAGFSAFYPESDRTFPKAFTEVLGRPMIQKVIENLSTIKQEKHFIFIVNEIDVKKYRIDNVLRMLTDNHCEIIVQMGATRGAVCSLLLAIQHINHENPILVSNADQIIDHDLNELLEILGSPEVDGGVVTFESVHPQWSYASIDKYGRVIETAEKKPISRNAIAGLYYFSQGKDFIESAKNSILKDRSHNGMYYTSTILNEMILKNKNIIASQIASDEYHSFYLPEKIKEYEGIRQIEPT